MSALVERSEALAYIDVVLDEYYRHGSCDIRLVVSNTPAEVWDQIDGRLIRRWPQGEVKVERLAIGVSVEWERAADERKAA